MVCLCVIAQDPTRETVETSRTAIKNIIAVTRGDPWPIPLFQDIVTAENLHAMLMASIRPDQDRVFQHFDMTPIDVIKPG